ncbi:MAG: FitA-like ribbon-helix-helix domain-containing protein [Candidatus Nanopelagicales bacterium]
MGQLLARSVDDHLIAALRRRAAAHGRSVERNTGSSCARLWVETGPSPTCWLPSRRWAMTPTSSAGKTAGGPSNCEPAGVSRWHQCAQANCERASVRIQES